MTQKERLLELFRENNNELTLSQIMQTTLGCEYRARISELRKDGLNIVCTIHRKSPSGNLYTLIPNEASRKLMGIKDTSGQMEFAY